MREERELAREEEEDKGDGDNDDDDNDNEERLGVELVMVSIGRCYIG